MTKILGLSGKKQSGKTTTANWIIGQQMVSCNLVTWVKMDTLGRLVVPAEVDGELSDGIFDPLTMNPEAQQLLAQYVWPVVKLYSFADVLKMATAAIFGLAYEQVNGTNDDKNAPTQYEWEQFLPFLDNETKQMAYDIWNEPMTSRHILQVFGTDICRRIHSDVWVNACLKNVVEEGSELAIITDCRFPNEVKGIQDAGGKVIRFLRAPFEGEDEHESETALDDFEGFDHVFDNRELSIQEQNKATNALLKEWGYNTWEWELND